MLLFIFKRPINLKKFKFFCSYINYLVYVLCFSNLYWATEVTNKCKLRGMVVFCFKKTYFCSALNISMHAYYCHCIRCSVVLSNIAFLYIEGSAATSLKILH